jgi:hypothetical protein
MSRGRQCLAAHVAVGVLVAFCSLGAQAHHSYGMFDRSKEVTVSGTVQEFEWTNPHSRVSLLVPAARGDAQVWDIEMGPPGQLVRSGWKRLSLKPGDKVDILINPLRDGQLGGHLLIVTTASGEKLYDIVFKHPPSA